MKRIFQLLKLYYAK